MNNRILLLTVVLIFLGLQPLAQGALTDWSYNVGGLGGEKIRNITTDNTGNTYVTGSFTDTFDANMGTGISTLFTSGTHNTFFMKISSTGSLVWAKSIGGTDFNWGNAIAVDSIGNIYCTGSFSGTVDFDPGTGTSNHTSSDGSAFILKLDNNGNFQWVKIIESTGTNPNPSQGLSIAIDHNFNVLTTGKFFNTTDFNNGSGANVNTPLGSSDIYVTKHDSTGNYLWSKTFGGTLTDQPKSIFVDENNNVFTAGLYSDIVDFDPSVNIDNYQSTAASFIHKMDGNGNYQWVKSFGDNGGSLQSATIDENGNIYCSGLLTDTADFDPGIGVSNLSQPSLGFFILKMDNNGSHTWSQAYGDGPISFALSIKLDTSKNIIIAGVYRDTLNMGNDIYIVNPNASLISFVSKLDNNGEAIWAESIQSSTGDASRCESISIFNDNIYIGGYYKGTADFDVSINTQNSSSNGDDDMYLLKLDYCNYAHATDVQNVCGPFTWIDGKTYTSSNSIATFNLQNMAANGCDSIVTLDLTINNIDTSVVYSPFELTANSVGDSYQWLDCNNGQTPILGATLQTFIPTSNGNYAVEVTTTNCVDTSSCYAMTTVGIEDVIPSQFSTYPNPSSKNLIIEIDDQLIGENALIFNIQGQLITTLLLSDKKSVIPVDYLENGLYLIKIENQTIRFVKN